MKSYVTIEQAYCAVCGETFDDGGLLIDTKLRDSFEHKTVTHQRLCETHRRLCADGYLALVEIDPSKSVCSGGTMKSDDAYRTGRIAHIRRKVADRIFNVKTDKIPMVFIDPEAFEKIVEMAGQAEVKAGDNEGVVKMKTSMLGKPARKGMK